MRTQRQIRRTFETNFRKIPKKFKEIIENILKIFQKETGHKRTTVFASDVIKKVLLNGKIGRKKN